jgi:penicillin-binding protein 2
MEKRITAAIYIVILLCLTLVFRLWYLQILRGNEYREIDERNRLRVLNIVPPRGIIYDRNNRPLVKNIPSFDIAVVKEDIPKDPETLSSLGRLIGMKKDEIEKRLDSRPLKPFEPLTLKEDVSFQEVARVEAGKIAFPGLQVKVVSGREYIYGHAASHALGYIGSLTLAQMKSPQYSDVHPESSVGQFGIEKVFDADLRGIAGKKVIEVDAVGSIMKVVRIQRPIKGRDIRLTIDIDLQVEAEKNLRGKEGAVVALNTDTGEVLAIASSPTFDPNLFVRGIEHRDWKKLVNDPRKPMLNRAIQSQYPPGSTFKIVTAITALEEGLITEHTDYYCKGSIYFGRVFRCWKRGGHGSVMLHESLVESCDVYYYEIAKELDVDTLAQYAFSYGLGRPTGIEIDGEAKGIVPTSSWKYERQKERWYTGETLNTVIGQGYLSATPIQMARVIATVVNGGKLYEPYLLMEDGKKPKPEGVVKIGSKNVEIIKKALAGVVKDKEGTGGRAASDIVSVGGKTGTTQVVGGVRKEEDVPHKFRDHAWFVAFAPLDKPQIAVAVFIEHGGHGSTSAAPIAKKIIEEYFSENDKSLNEKDSGGV